MKKDNKSKDDVLVSNGQNEMVDIGPFLMPIAIMTAGFMIAMGVFFGLHNRSQTPQTQSTTAATSAANEPGVGEQQPTAPSRKKAESPAPSAKVTTNIGGDNAYLGNRDTAKVAIIEFSDMECPFCQRHALNTQKELVKNYVDTGKAIYVFRNLPLPQLHAQAMDRAKAIICANKLGGSETAFGLHDAIFADANFSGNIDLSALATAQGLDKSKFEACMNDDDTLAKVNSDAEEANSLGISGTPGFVVGTLDENGDVVGTVVAGAYPYSYFADILDPLLETEK